MSVAGKISTAVAEMVDKFRVVWEPRPCHYPGYDFELPSSETAWARITIQHFDGSQGSLANVVGKRRWMRGGNITVQVFAPLKSSEVSAYDLAEIVCGAYEGKRTPSGAWFRNVRINEVNPSNDNWKQLNVIIDFEYDQIH